MATVNPRRYIDPRTGRELPAGDPRTLETKAERIAAARAAEAAFDRLHAGLEMQRRAARRLRELRGNPANRRPNVWPFNRRRDGPKKGPRYRSLEDGRREYERLGQAAYWAQYGLPPERRPRRRPRRRNPMGHGEIIDLLIPLVALWLLVRSGRLKIGR